MVEIGDKVIVAPLDGQKDKMAIITGPAGAGAVLNEGDYNTWTLEWKNSFPHGLGSSDEFDVLMDEKNSKLDIIWRDSSYNKRLGIYNINDLSIVHESATNYTAHYPGLTFKQNFVTGIAYLNSGGFSQSIQTYLLLLRSDWYTIEVWRGGVSALWSRDVRTDFHTNNIDFEYGGISLTGKYILLMIQDKDTWDYYLSLYKGSFV